MNTSVRIGQQAKATYENYGKIKQFQDVGHFLQEYVNDGGIVTKDTTCNNIVHVTDISASLSNSIMYREGTSFKTEIPYTTYYLDFHEDGDWKWGTGHPTGKYLTVAEVTTDENGNVETITDKAEPRGGFRLKSEFGLEDYSTKEELGQFSGFNQNTIIPTFENGQLTKVEEKDGESIISSSEVTYNPDGSVATVAETYNGQTVVNTLHYADGEFSGVTRTLGGVI